MIPELSVNSLLEEELISGFRFSVTFFAGGVVPNPLDIRFKKVSGLSAEVTTETVGDGGQNLYTQKLPTGVSYGNLVLERGMVIGSPLKIDLQLAISGFKFAPCTVLVALLSPNWVPLSAWMFFTAYPVKWSFSDLDAETPALMIETMELAYTSMQIISI